MNKEQLQEQINQFKDQINIFQKQLDELQEEQIDFSKWIGRDDDILAIKGDKYLISYPNGGVLYRGIHKDNFTDKITYRIGKRKDLKIGDVFMLKDYIDNVDNVDNIDISSFKLFMGKDDYGDYISHYLYKDNGFERLLYNSIDEHRGDEEIIIFNRN